MYRLFIHSVDPYRFVFSPTYEQLHVNMMSIYSSILNSFFLTHLSYVHCVTLFSYIILQSPSRYSKCNFPSKILYAFIVSQTLATCQPAELPQISVSCHYRATCISRACSLYNNPNDCFILPFLIYLIRTNFF